MSSRSKWRPFKQLVQQNGRQDYVLPIASIDYTKDTITLAGSTSSPIGQGSRYYIFNAADQLNATDDITSIQRGFMVRSVGYKWLAVERLGRLHRENE